MKLFVYYLVAALLVLGTNGQVTWTCPTNSQPVTLANSYMVTIPTNISNSIPILFREGSTPHPSLVSLQTPTSIKLTAPSNISITFITQTSNFRNQLGYFIFNEGTQNVDDSTPLSALPLIWPDVTRSGLSVTPKGCMTAGLTTRIGPFAAGTRIGFFMRQDGYLDANNYKLNNTIWWSINSTNLVNLDGYRHTSIVSIDGKIIVGFEDFTGMGDQDYNDVLFYATVEGGWDGTGIPVYNGEVVDTCLTGKVVKTRNYNCRSYGLLGTSNFQGCLGYISIPAGWSIADQSESTRLVITNTKNFNWDRYTGQNICMMTSNGNGVYQNGTDCTPMPIKYLSTNNRCVYVPCDRGILLAGPNVTNCQQTLSKCNVTNNNVIIGQTPATKANTSIVYPNTYSVLVSTVVNSKLPLNFDVWVPTKPNVDVFVAIDLNGLSAATLDNIRTQLSSFYTQASNLWNVKLGFGTFWTNGTTLGVNSHLFLTNNAATISSVAASFTPPNNLVPGPTSRVVEAYRYFAGNSTIGWRRSACFGVVVVLTGRPMFSYTARLMADMASWNNVPVFFSNVNATTYNIYQNFINNLPIGYNGALTDTYQNWPSMAMDVLNNYTVRVQFDPFYTSTPSWNELYWVRSDMPSVFYNPPLGAWTTRAAPLTYPGTYPVNDFGVIEIFTVNMICWGYRSMGVAVNLNNPPRVSNLIFSFNEDESFDFDLYGRVSDPENNALTVQLLSLPGANGVLTYQDATVISVGTIYDQSSLLFNIKSIPANWNGQLNMTYQANDGCVNSTVGTITFNVLPVNDPPTNEDFSSTTKEDTSVLLDFSTHIADIDDLNSTLRIYIQSLPNFGTLKDGSTVVTAGSTLTGQTVTFVPAANFNGIVTFTYKAVDPSNAKSLSASTVTVTVTAVPDPPTSTNIEVTTKMNAPVSFRLSGTSLDGNPISVILQTLPGKGTLTNNGASLSATPVNVGLTTAHNLTFTPPVNQFAVPMTTFLFKVNDGLDSVSSYTVTINVVSDGALINLPPTGADTSLTTPEDTDLLVNVTSLLSDGEDPIWNLTVTIETLPSFGTLRNGATQLVKGSVLPAKAVTYRPNLNYNGPDSFIYRVSDSQFYDLGTISITVTPVNDPPTSVDMTFTTYEDTSITLSGFVVNDVDSSDSTFTMNITKNVDKGALTVGPTTLDVGSTLPPVYTSWAILYTPPTGLNSGDDTTVFTTFKFRVSDGLLNSVNEYTVKIIVIPVNDPPAGEDIILDTLEDTPIQVTFNPRDVDNAPSTLVITITSVLKGSFFLESTGNTSIKTGTVLPFNGRSMWFFPDADASSTTEPLGVFRYQVSDPDGGLSPEYSGVVWVTPVNDPPVYKGLLDFTTYEDTPIEMNFGVEVLDVDSEGPFTLTVTRTVPLGSLWECTNSDKQCNKVMIVSTPYQLVNKDLLVSFIALPDEFGLRYANFTFTVTDEQGAVSIPYFVNINVIGVNDPPVIVPKFNVLPGRVDMDEDTTLVLEWTVTDIDSPLDTIVSSISVPIPASPGADLFVCPIATDGVCAQPYGDQLVTPMAIPSLSPASYRVVFIPTPDQWDERNYASLTFTAQDDQGADARPVKAIIRVLPINDPPYIQANSTVTITAPSDGALPAFTFREFNLGDPDARKQEIYFTVSIPANAGTLNVTYPRAFEAIGKKPAACVDLSDENTIMINCSDPQTTLNELYFKSVTFQPSDSQMSTVVSVYVDDLGNTDKLKRPLNTSQDVTINYSRDTGLTTESTEPDNTLTIALSVSAGAAVAGVATAIALTRKARMAKVDDFFEKLGDTFDTSNTSPIYQGDQMKQFNSPFYQPKNDNI